MPVEPVESSRIQCNVRYFGTLSGILKIIQLILGCTCMGLTAPAFWISTHFFLFVVVTTFIITILWCFMYMFGIGEVLNFHLNWLKIELLTTSISALSYLVVSIVQFIAWHGYVGRIVGLNIAGGVFGIFNCIAYITGAFYLYWDPGFR
ncbi:uncharacterized protein DMENIID0001_034800 [Sergentomyia squamirostris]